MPILLKRTHERVRASLSFSPQKNKRWIRELYKHNKTKQKRRRKIYEHR